MLLAHNEFLAYAAAEKTSGTATSKPAANARIRLSLNFPISKNIPETAAVNTPTEGRYTLYSSITQGMGMMLDSTDKVTKNQNIKKDNKRE